MERVNFTLSKTHLKKLRVMTKQTGISVSEFLRRVIDERWEKFEKKETSK